MVRLIQVKWVIHVEVALNIWANIVVVEWEIESAFEIHLHKSKEIFTTLSVKNLQTVQ